MVRDAVGKYTTGNNFLIWCTQPELCGIALWGRLSLSELEILTRVYDHGEHSGVALPCDFVFDARRLEGLESGAFEALARDAARRGANLRRRLRRQALLRSSGILGAALSGFYTLLEFELESRVFTELSVALAWLDEGDGVLCPMLEELIAQAISGSSVVDRCRGHLEAHIGDRPTLEGTARALTVSTRSLQRQLREAGTTFREEVDRVRLSIAQKLLLESDLKIAAIAARVGASTEASFITSFRRVVQVSPSDWRRQQLAKTEKNGR